MMMNKNSIGMRLTLAFGLTTAILVITVGIAFKGFRSLQMALEAVKQQSIQIVAAKDTYGQAMATLSYVAAAASASELALGQHYAELAQSHHDAYQAELETLKGTVHTEESKQVLDALETTLAAAWEANKVVIETSQGSQRDQAIKTFAAVICPKIAKWEKACTALVLTSQTQMDEALAKAEATVRRSILSILVSGVIAIAAAAVLGFLITQSITQPVKGFMAVLEKVATGDLTVQAPVNSSDEIGQLGTYLNQTLRRIGTIIREVSEASSSVASGATELSSTTEQLSNTTSEIGDGAEHQRVAMGQFSAMDHKISDSILDVNERMEMANRLSAESLKMAAGGLSSAQQASKSMEAIKESSDKVGKITGVITDIARQTNLLSLNAAIEAAKAGDQGKGFAVVAEEVRKLAERSGLAAKEITELIRESTEKVQEGSVLVAGATTTLAAIEANIRDRSKEVSHIGVAIKDITQATKEQAKTTEELAMQTERNASAIHELASTTQEIARTTEDLAKIANQLQASTSQFTV